MLQLKKEKGIIKLIADAYVLTWAADKPYIYLDTPMGTRLAELFPYSSIHPLHGRDDTTSVSAWEVQEQGDEIILSSTATSSVWKRKIFRFRCKPRRFIYETAVEGSGYLSEVNYFGGFYSGQVRWGSGFFWSGQRFQRGFNPEPNTDEVNEFMPGEGSMIDLMGVPLPGKGHWFFTPPPFCFAFLGAPFKQNTGKHQGSIHGNARQDPEKVKPVWLGLGVEAYPGENRFMEYGYHGRNGGFYLSLGFEGHTKVSGYYCLPAIGFDFANDAYTVLAGHVSALQEKEAVSWPEPRYKPAWWSEPIFCGWGAQCYQAALQKAKAPDFARQDLYEQFLKQLEENGIVPGTIVLDDKWQLTYGENQVDEQKWPDLVGFIRHQHAEGRKVLLWLKAWDAEGIPVEECITNAQGLPLAIDPTNLQHESRLRKSIRQMLSPTGYNADGFKIDFTARIPSGPGICTYGDLWGLELMRHYLQIIYDEAKLTKRDALIMTHTPHPYLADVVDMIRLNDINQDKDVIQAMKLRATIARISCPEAIIDTDNWPVKDLATWRNYLRLQPMLGVPSLYFVSHIDSTKEPFTPQDYRLIRMAWAKYRAKGMPVAKKTHRFTLKPRRNFWESDFATRFHLAITGRN